MNIRKRQERQKIQESSTLSTCLNFDSLEFSPEDNDDSFQRLNPHILRILGTLLLIPILSPIVITWVLKGSLIKKIIFFVEPRLRKRPY